MIVVIEITNKRGTRARKEYDAPSLNTAVMAAEVELRKYPTFWIVDAWVDGDSTHQPDTAEEW